MKFFDVVLGAGCILIISLWLGLARNQAAAQPMNLLWPLPALLPGDVELISGLRLQMEGKFRFIDARPVKQFAKSRIKGALSIPAGTDLSEAYTRSGLTDESCVVYCQNPGCSMADQVAQYLRTRGHRAVILRAGFVAWSSQKLPVEP